MRFSKAIDVYVADMRAAGRFNSDRTEVAYRATLGCHAEDVSNRDPSKTNRDDVKRTLRRWGHPNTQAKNRSHLISFYVWTVQEGLRRDNPAEQTRPPRKRPAQVYRLTHAEAVRMLLACQTRRERWAISLGSAPACGVPNSAAYRVVICFGRATSTSQPVSRRVAVSAGCLSSRRCAR
jgi:site-specific recombinase XerD